MLLDIDDTTLDDIARDNKNPEDCCKALQKRCQKNITSPDWNEIHDLISITVLLQELYKNERNKDKEGWILFQPEHCVNISIICHSERIPTCKGIEAVAMATHKGKISIESNPYISSCTQLTCLFDIFYPNETEDNTKKVILIEGAPGFGKTVLSREIAFQWANEKILCNKILLFLIHLHEPQISQIKSLEQFVCYALKSSPSNKLIKCTVEHLQKTFGRYCTILLEGYDRISNKVEDSYILKIIKRERLPLCGLVITSSPTASADLLRIGTVDCRFEILGFTECDRNEYIHKNLKGEEITMLQNYLEKNYFMSTSCYIPLNMTILLHIFKEFAEIPKTQTDIYSQFIYIAISRYISKEEKKAVTIKSPDDLQTPYKQQFKYLCKLAYYLLQSEKVVFNDDDIKKYINIKPTANWSTLGLLREANYYSVLENEIKKSYSYLHLSMQECLAAHYIASSKEKKVNF